MSAALTGELDDVGVTPDLMFGVGIPSAVPGVPPEVLHPRETWTDRPTTTQHPGAGRAIRRELRPEYADLASGEVLAAGPNQTPDPLPLSGLGQPQAAAGMGSPSSSLTHQGAASTPS